MAKKPLLRLGQQVPVEHSFDLLSVQARSGKLVKQLFWDPDNHAAYLCFNAVVMAIAGEVEILEPYMLEDASFNGAVKAAVVTRQEEVKKP
jgi:hypothetical protein